MVKEVGPVKLNRATMNQILGGMMDGQVRADANRIAAQARAIAPVDTGAYQRSIRVEPFTRNERGGVRRSMFRVIAGGAGTKHANLVEIQASVLARAMGASAGRSRTNR